MAEGSLTFESLSKSLYDGICSMNEVFFLTLFCGGMSKMVAKNGGIAWVVDKFKKVMVGNRSAQLGIASLVSACDCATANNTVAIVIVGGTAKEISSKYKVDPRVTASLLDIFSCVFQGIIPYGAQLVVAANLASAASTSGSVVSAISIAPRMYYCWILAAIGVLSIFFPVFHKFLSKDEWNFDKWCPESLTSTK